MMQTITEHIRNHIWTSLGMAATVAMPGLDSLRAIEWCGDFEQLMRNRLIIGAFRYGRFGDSRKSQYACAPSIIERTRLYQDSGNLEHLVDVANLAMVEFVHGRHPRRHFHAGDDGPHVEVLP